MGRTPRPWYWKARRSWFVTLDGKRHNLGPDKAAAHDRFHELMSQPQKRVIRSDSVLAIIDAFLDWCEKHRSPDTYEWYRYRLQRFAETYPDLSAGRLRPFHVQQWLDGMTGLSGGSKRNHCRAVKRAMRWALRQGYIEQNPIAHLEQPKGGKRELVIRQEEFDEILTLISHRSFRDLVVTTWETGCRPQESLRVEGRHVDLANSRWVFPETEGKGGIPRIVYLTETAVEITRRLMLQNPSGKLFRNSNGRPWTTDAVNCAFVRLQIRMGGQVMKKRRVALDDGKVREFAATLKRERMVGGRIVEKSEKEMLQESRRKLRYRAACEHAEKYSLYTLRHSWATHALERGLDALTVAVLMGHKDPSTLARVYQHLAHSPQYLLEQARKAAG
jgi:integrase